jgi:putative ABC transport system permease protein
MGVRIALGADPLRIKTFVVADTLRWGAVGMGGSLVGTVMQAGVLRPIVFGVEPTDPRMLGWVAAAFVAVAPVASYLRARRAAGVDPIVALRSE